MDGFRVAYCARLDSPTQLFILLLAGSQQNTSKNPPIDSNEVCNKGHWKVSFRPQKTHQRTFTGLHIQVFVEH